MKIITTEVKSKITLEDIRPYISSIHGFVCIPFGDYGFLMSKEEIESFKLKYDEYFKKYAAMILGVSVEEVSTKLIKRKEGNKEWCWKYNMSYTITTNKRKEPSIAISINDNMNQTFSISFNNRYSYVGGSIGYFNIDGNGIIYQRTPFEINSIEDIAKILNQKEKNDIEKELTKMKKAEKTAEKSLNTIKGKIKNLETRLNKLD